MKWNEDLKLSWSRLVTYFTPCTLEQEEISLSVFFRISRHPPPSTRLLPLHSIFTTTPPPKTLHRRMRSYNNVTTFIQYDGTNEFQYSLSTLDPPSISLPFHRRTPQLTKGPKTRTVIHPYNIPSMSPHHPRQFELNQLLMDWCIKRNHHQCRSWHYQKISPYNKYIRLAVASATQHIYRAFINLFFVPLPYTVTLLQQLNTTPIRIKTFRFPIF